MIESARKEISKESGNQGLTTTEAKKSLRKIAVCQI